MKTHLILDFDSTFAQVEALDELARIALEGTDDRTERVEQIERLTRDAMDGTTSFGESLTKRLKLFAATPEDIKRLIGLLQGRVTASVLEHKEFIRKNHEQIYIISGGFREYIVPVVAEFGIAADHVVANEFVFDAEGRVAGCDQANPLAHDGGKVKALGKLALKGPAIMVGDGYSDLRARLDGAVDYFVAFVENVDRPAVSGRADAVAETFSDVVAFEPRIAEGFDSVANLR
jgi:D-3-phosphoglycerate dehydrogenase / 2-oxoglutarate reductase